MFFNGNTEFGSDWLRRRLASPRSSQASIVADEFRVPSAGDYRPAAVLVPVVERSSGLTILLTRRTPFLRQHAGQICFPGGRVEPEDLTPAHTALRETEEEIGLAADKVELLGHLDDYMTGTGYRVTPVVGLVRQPFELFPDASEVEEVFELPLAILFDTNNHQFNSVFQDGKALKYFALPYRSHYIWGATAAMLINFYFLLSEADPS